MNATAEHLEASPEHQSFAREQLAIAVTDDEALHAMYPTASYTLCGIADDRIVDVADGHNDRPDCLVCATTAAAFDRIDRTAPATWFRAGEATWLA